MRKGAGISGTETVADAAHGFNAVRLNRGGAKFGAQAEALLDSVDPSSVLRDRQAIEQALNALEDHYQQLKARLLEAGAQGELPVAEMEVRLRIASMMRRAIEQAVKAALMLDDAPDAMAGRK